MPSDAIIDIDADFLTARAERRRRLARIGVPIVGVLLIILVILGIAVYAQNANRAGALMLSDEILAALDARIGEQVTAYFTPAKRAVAIASDLLAKEQPDQREMLFEKFSIAALKETPQIDSLNFGDGDGNFVMVRRNEQTAGIDTKVIHNTGGRRKVFWTRRDREGKESTRDQVPKDDYDPRTRPWFKEALANTGTVWTDVYTLYTSREMGITAAARIPQPNAGMSVLGADITVNELSGFLVGLALGTSGQAMIVDRNGRLIAYPRRGGEPRVERIDQLGDAAAVAAFDRFRIDGPGRRAVEIDGRRYLTTVRPIDVAGQDWSILIVANEKEFIGFVARNNRVGLLMSLAIVFLAAIGAGLLVRQGLRTDRASRLARDRSHALGRQSELLQELARDPDLFDLARDQPPTALTESAAEISEARRASVWYLLPNRQTLHCADSFQREGSAHTGGFEVTRGEAPRFFESLVSGAEIEVAAAAADPRTADLHRLLLAPFGSRSIAVFPVQRKGLIVGAVWLEDAIRLAESRQFLRLIAGMAALNALDHATAATSSETAVRDAEPATPQETYSASADLARLPEEPIPFADGVFPDISVMALRIDNAGPTGVAATPELLDEIIRSIQQIAAEQDIPYLKIVGSEIVGAAGFAAGDSTAVARIANTAVASRERIAEMCETHQLTPEFRLGIDRGGAIGRTIGADPGVFNLWGQAVEVAQTLAASALPGAIQTSEAAYTRLNRSFLFRPRGSFFHPSAGVGQTFILAGRL